MAQMCAGARAVPESIDPRDRGVNLSRGAGLLASAEPGWTVQSKESRDKEKVKRQRPAVSFIETHTLQSRALIATCSRRVINAVVMVGIESSLKASRCVSFLEKQLLIMFCQDGSHTNTVKVSLQ